MKVDLQWLEDCVFKRPLETGEAHLLEQSLRIESREKGEILICEGQPCDGLYFIHSGRVGIYHNNHGEDVRISEAGEGAQLGDMASFGDGIASATVKTIEPCVIYKLPQRALIHLMTYRQRLARDMMMNTIRHLAEVIRNMNRSTAYSQQYISRAASF